MKHTMGTPCKHCPFRTDIKGYLTADRVIEISESLFQGASFPCHETTEAWGDDDGESEMVATNDSQQCAGAEIFLASQGMSTQMGRIAERLGMKVAKLNKKAPVCRTVDEMLAVHGHEPDGEACSVCDSDCEAPAGYMVGNGVIPCLEVAEYVCEECGQPVCGACSKASGKGKKRRVCNHCMEDEP